MSTANANTDSGFAHHGFVWPGPVASSAEVRMVQQRSYLSLADQRKRCVEDLSNRVQAPSHVLATLL